MKKYVCVGGGIAGIYAALFLAKRGLPTVLIEAQSSLGGLLRSFESQGFSFDYGTHYLRDTGISEIDEELFLNLSDNWQRLKFLKIGTYFNGQFYDKSSFINAHHLSPELYEKGIQELKAMPPFKGEAKNCYEWLVNCFGITFTEHLFLPPLQKFFREDLKSLAPNASLLFDLVRIIAFSPEESRELKKDPWFDERIAFHFSNEGQSGLNNYYPSFGGIGQWIESLEERLQEYGVEILKDTVVQEIKTQDGRVETLNLCDGTSIECENLIWSVPLPLLAKLTQTDLGQKFSVKLNTSVLCYFIYDKPFKTDVYYTVCYDPAFKSFRTSLFPNMNNNDPESKKYHCCVEVVVPRGEEELVQTQDIHEELLQMGLVNREANLLFSEKKVEQAGFPTFTNEFVNGMAHVREIIENSFSNVSLVGKANGKTFFQNHTLIEAHKTLKSLLEA